MASAATFEDICAVCLDTRPLKIVGRCKHRFCEECLTITLESQEGDVFACPTCKVDCPRPWDGVKGMVDFTGEDVPVIDTVVGAVQRGRKEELQPRGRGKAGAKAGAKAERLLKEGREEGKRKKKKDRNADSMTVDVKCKICHHKKKEVQAVNLCVECSSLHICEECTKVHARNKATQGHVVVRLRPEMKKEEAMCEEHDSPLNSFCRDCGEAVCMVCVMLAHGQHTVETLVDVVDEKVNELKVILENKQKRLGKLKDLKKDLALLKLMVPLVDKQDALIKEIEAHAQRFFEQITKWKEALKDLVKEEHKVTKEIPVGFEKVSKMVEELQEPTERAERLLTKTEHDREYLGKLIALQQEMDALVDEEGDTIEEGYRPQLKELHEKHHTFFPEEIPLSFGRIGCDDDQASDKKCTRIFRKTMQAASKDMFIPCVANLGQMFAVAHPTRLWESSVAIDIYELPGTLKHTFTDHVPPLYDMASTPDGKLAVLSDGTGGTGYSVKLFDTDTGYISSTHDINITEPLSLGVTLQHQYVILGGNEEKVITVVDKSGVVEHTLKIDKDFIKKKSDKEYESDESDESDVDSDDTVQKDTKCDSDVALDAGADSKKDMDSIVAVEIPKRLACGGRFIFVAGDKILAVYEITRREIHACKIFKFKDWDKCIDISATIWDDYFVADFDVNLEAVWLEKWVIDNVSKCKWDSRDWSDVHKIYHVKSGDERPTRVSIRDRHVVVCHGKKIRVFNIQ